MEREQLKGKQTPGPVLVHYGPYGAWEIESNTGGHSGGHLTIASRAMHPRIKDQQHANAALYAEAHNVANRTGMWPEDFEARVKELEKALRGMVDWFEMRRPSAPVDKARAILNKKPA